MADIDFKNSVNADTAYVDGHKVKLIAVPDGSLELPISANDEYGYVVDASDKKHRVLLTAFLEGDPDYKSSANADTAYLTVNGQKVKVCLGAKLNGTQYLSNSANVNDCYTEDDDGNKHRTMLVATPTGTLELPTSETDDSAYVIDGDGKKHKVRLFIVVAGGAVEITLKGVPPLSLVGAIADSLTSLKAFGGTKIDPATPDVSDPSDIYCNNGKISVLDHTNWNVITNPNQEAGKGMFINTSGVLSKASDRGAGVFIPVTVGKKYTVLINKQTTSLGSIIRYGQSNNGDLPSASEQLLDWYRGTIVDGMMISFTAKRPYFVMQLGADPVEAGMVDEAIEVIEAAGDNETLAIATKNLFDADKIFGQRAQYTKEDNGEWTATTSDGAGWGVLYTNGFFITLSAGTYTLSSTEPDTHFSYANASSTSDISDLNGGTWYELPKTFTVTEPTNFTVKIKKRANGAWVYPGNIGKIQLELDSRATDYVDYNGSTATANNLFAVSTYKDVQEIITGATTHKVGVYVFNGTENWTFATGSNCPARCALNNLIKGIPNTDIAPFICSHFIPTAWNDISVASRTTPYIIISNTTTPFIAMTVGWDNSITDLASWKAFLAAQYAAGTPVTIVFPLETPFEEVAPIAQSMTVVDGDNTVSLTQQGMTPLELEATYTKQQ